MKSGRRWLGMGMTIIAGLVVAAPASAHVPLHADMTTAQEVPAPTGSSATGTANFAFEEATGQITYEITVTGLTGTALAAHIHVGAPGVAGNVIVPLDATTLKGIADVPPEQVAALLGGGTYVNVHTQANPLGEIRGQILPRHGSCDCRSLTHAAFKKCVNGAIKGLSKTDRKLAEIKALKKAAAASACGRTKGPKKAVACCFESEALTLAENIVVGNLCVAIPEKACSKRGGESLGAGTSCFPTNPCVPPASPSGAFLDGVQF